MTATPEFSSKPEPIVRVTPAAPNAAAVPEETDFYPPSPEFMSIMKAVEVILDTEEASPLRLIHALHDVASLVAQQMFEDFFDYLDENNLL